MNDKKTLRLSSKIKIILFLALLLISSVIVTLFFINKDDPFLTPVITEDLDSYKNPFLRVYDPDTDSYLYLYNGKLLTGGIPAGREVGSAPVYPIGTYTNQTAGKDVTGFISAYRVTEASGGTSELKTKYIFVCEYGQKVLDFSSVTTDTSSIDVCAVSDDGRFAFFYISDRYSPLPSLYVIDGMGEGCAPRLLAYGVSKFCTAGASRVAYATDNGNGGLDLVVADLAASTEKVLSSVSDCSVIFYTESVNAVSFVCGRGDLGVFYIDTGSFVTINYESYSDGISKYAAHVFSASGDSLALYTQGNGRFTAYIYVKDVMRAIFDDMIPVAVSDDGKCVYALSPDGNNVYSAVNLREKILLAENAEIKAVSADRRQAIISSEEGGLYLSADGQYPTRIFNGKVFDFYPLTSCEDGFIGELFYIETDVCQTGIFRLNSDCKLESVFNTGLLTTKQYTLLSDNKTILFITSSNALYKARAGVDKGEAEHIGFASSLLDVERDGSTSYYFDRPVLLRSHDKKTSVIESEDVCGLFVFPEGGAAYMKHKGTANGKMLYDIYLTDGQNASEPELSGILSAFRVGDVLYVIGQSAKGEDFIDVYVLSPDGVSLIVSGVKDLTIPSSDASR